MGRSGPGFPVWAFACFWLGGVCGYIAGLGVATKAEEPDQIRFLAAAFLAGALATGGAVVGGIRDMLTFLDHRLPTAPHDPRNDYRDPSA